MATSHEQLETALAHHRQGRLHEAEALYRQVLASEPNQADALHLLGLVAHQTGHSEQAIELIGRAIAARGNVAEFHNNLGEAYRTLGRFDEAIAAYEQAIRLAPAFAEAHNNLGTAYQSEGRTDDALASFERAIAARPDYANAHYNRARAWLGQGNFAAGWPEYEWRWKRDEFRRAPLAEPEWDGSPLDGRRLLVRAEQGYGDTLQFIRYVPLLQAQGGDVLVEVQPELVELLTQSGIGPLVPQGAPLGEFDVHASLLSLPGLLRTTLDTIPAGVPYVAASEKLVEQWARRLRGVRPIRVGVNWQGNPQFIHDPLRSIPLHSFAALARVPNVRLVSLQRVRGLEQLASVSGQFEVVDLRPEYDLEDGAFLNAAAVMSNLDLVVTSDTAVAHLAGAMAIGVWVVLPGSADWRWLQHRTDSPWYPTMRLFRQSQRGDWSSVMAQVAEALATGGLSRTSRSDRAPERPANG